MQKLLTSPGIHPAIALIGKPEPLQVVIIFATTDEFFTSIFNLLRGDILAHFLNLFWDRVPYGRRDGEYDRYLCGLQ